MDIEFNDIKELYTRLEPALSTKVAELKRNDMSYIQKEDVWNFLKVTKWLKASNLLLYQMVDDILNVDKFDIDRYVKENMKKIKKEPILDN